MELQKQKPSQYERYETLLIEKEQLQKESNQIWFAYLRLFGKIITDIYEAKIECIRLKKIISYYQAALNHHKSINKNDMYNQIETEMSAYRHKLKEMIQETNFASRSTPVSHLEIKNIKTKYRRIAKLLHPDMNPETNKHNYLMELWNRVQIAYHTNNLKDLSELEILVIRALKNKNIQIEIPDIDEKIHLLEQEINLILNKEPYLFKNILGQDKKIEEKKETLQAELSTYQQYQKELTSIIGHLEERNLDPCQMN